MFNQCFKCVNLHWKLLHMINHRPPVLRLRIVLSTGHERPVWIQSTSQSTLSSLLELNFRDMTVDLHLLRMIRFLPNAAQANLYIYVHGAPE